MLDFKLRLKRREDCLILKLDALSPKVPTQKLDNGQGPAAAFTVHILLFCGS